MGTGPGTLGMGLGEFVPMWAVMMAAMMLPSVAPVGSIYLRGIQVEQAPLIRGLRSAGLLLGYLGVWVAFGLIAYGIAWAAGGVASADPRLAPWAAAGLLALAGVYQLTPLKDRCLRHCRSPFGLLIRYGGYSGRLRDLRVGVAHGSYCLGCCWGLMAVLVAVGVTNLAWMAALAAVVFLEKTLSWGRWLSVAVGVALIGLALLVPSHLALAPGFLAGPAMSS